MRISNDIIKNAYISNRSWSHDRSGMMNASSHMNTSSRGGGQGHGFCGGSSSMLLASQQNLELSMCSTTTQSTNLNRTRPKTSREILQEIARLTNGTGIEDEDDDVNPDASFQMPPNTNFDHNHNHHNHHQHHHKQTKSNKKY